MGFIPYIHQFIMRYYNIVLPTNDYSLLASFRGDIAPPRKILIFRGGVAWPGNEANSLYTCVTVDRVLYSSTMPPYTSASPEIRVGEGIMGHLFSLPWNSDRESWNLEWMLLVRTTIHMNFDTEKTTRKLYETHVHIMRPLSDTQRKDRK